MVVGSYRPSVVCFVQKLNKLKDVEVDVSDTVPPSVLLGVGLGLGDIVVLLLAAILLTRVWDGNYYTLRDTFINPFCPFC